VATREPLRAEARRRGVTVYRVRVERALAQGLSPRVGVGHARSERGELPLSRLPRVWTELPGQPITHGGRQASRMAKLSGDQGRLLRGRLTDIQFDRRWAGKSIGPYQVPSAREVRAEARTRGPRPPKPYRTLVPPRAA
jgi:hypothetical protein